MALTQMHWRKLTPKLPASNDMDDVLDAVADAFDDTTYYDTAPRTPGSGSAWTFAAEVDTVTVSLRGTPPAAAVSDLRVVIAGVESGVYTPTMQFDTFSAERILTSVHKTPGAFTNWDDANPFTSGNFFGYYKSLNLASNTVSEVHCYECEEAIAIAFRLSTDAVAIQFLGAFLDPGSDDPLDAESTDRLYGQLTCGSGAAPTTMWSNTTGFPGEDAAADGGVHAAVFIPGLGTVRTLARLTGGFAISTTNLVTHGGVNAGLPIHVQGNSRYMGRMREAYVFHDAILGTVYQSSGIDVGYALSSDGASDNDAIFLRY